jgi:hypothetical protein
MAVRVEKLGFGRSEEDVLWKEWWLRKERLRCSPPAPTTKNVAMFNVEFAGK